MEHVFGGTGLGNCGVGGGKEDGEMNRKQT